MEEKRYIGKIYLDGQGIPHAEFDDRHLSSWEIHTIVKTDAKNYYALVCPQCDLIIKTNILTDCDKQVIIDWTVRRKLNYCYKCGHENIRLNMTMAVLAE